ncbi:MAG TPA: tetratricopeptide repeat protein [Blastocatellia bacterium]|nr:tetratricopeptide repeat protein [Blastocatellia bacterium]
MSAYLERRLNAAGHDSMEGHLASCDRCRESVALLVYLQHRAGDSVENQQAVAVAPSLSVEDLRAQTSNVLSLIAEDERKRRPAKSSWSGRTIGWRLIPAPVMALAAMLVVAFLGWGVYQTVIPRETAADVAMNNIDKSLESSGRRTRTLLAGVRYAQPVEGSTRGAREIKTEAETDDMFLQAALASLRDASDTHAQLVKARALVATANRKDNIEGRKILQELLAMGVATAELYNDLGVASHQAGEYERAIEYFGEALKRDPGMIQALFNKALASLDNAEGIQSPAERAKLKEEARSDLDRFLAVCQNPHWKAEARRIRDEIDSPK